MSTTDLPLLNACLNATVVVLLLVGRRQIVRGNRDVHKKVMLSAIGLSAAFLASYLTYHALHGSKQFQGPPAVRVVYLSILVSHTILAAAALPLVVITLVRALRGRFAQHRSLAGLTWWIWLYVASTGVLVYVFAHRLYA